MNEPETFEQLIAEGKIEFNDAPLSALSQWGQFLVETFLTPNQIKWKLGNVRVGNVYCLKLDDPFLQYLDVFDDTKQFMWCTDNHHDAVHPDRALAHLIRKELGTEVYWAYNEETNFSRLIVRYPNGNTLIMDDQR